MVNSSGLIDHYRVLEIEQFSPMENVKKAFRKLALKMHPDKQKVNDSTEFI